MELFWIDEGLAVGPRPRAGSGLAEDLQTAREAGIDVLVSCLTPDEERSLGLTAEARTAVTRGLRFERAPIDDITTPSEVQPFLDVIGELVRARAEGRRVAIHCKMGIGRAPLTAASVLVAEGMEPAAAWARITERRGRPVPDNHVQESWVTDHARELRALAAVRTSPSPGPPATPRG
jgi:predicted protein tyrosine phosphatase